MWTNGGKLDDWRFTVEAIDVGTAEWKVRDHWNVVRDLVITPISKEG